MQSTFHSKELQMKANSPRWASDDVKFLFSHQPKRARKLCIAQKSSLLNGLWCHHGRRRIAGFSSGFALGQLTIIIELQKDAFCENAIESLYCCDLFDGSCTNI